MIDFFSELRPLLPRNSNTTEGNNIGGGMVRQGAMWLAAGVASWKEGSPGVMTLLPLDGTPTTRLSSAGGRIRSLPQWIGFTKPMVLVPPSPNDVVRQMTMSLQSSKEVTSDRTVSWCSSRVIIITTHLFLTSWLKSYEDLLQDATTKPIK